ncbi:XRE family transcriptional regulator [Sodalis glossinidius]|uniref:XRE family transcriptional regulator n=1 Tax=Sodalis glossinidius TaxID=63612 RepID=UPI0011D07967|nr:helix-turn-helix transcriptional regulator [Sodalis glossinidius]
MKLNFSERLKTAMREANCTQSTLAKAVGMAQSSVWKLTSGAAKSSTKVVEIARFLRVRPEWLASGIGEMHNSDVSNKHSISDITSTRQKISVWGDVENNYDFSDKFVEISLLNVKLSAGSGSCELNEDSEFSIIFSKYSLHNMGVSPSAAKLVRVSGSSMEPALNNGDIVGINIDKTSIEDGKTYAICHDDVLRIKTLISAPGKVVIRSFNREEYPDEVMSLNEFRECIRVIGQVFWSSHTW